MRLFLLLFLLSNCMFAKDVYVISHENISTSKNEIEKFFLAKIDFIDGKKYSRISNEASLNSLAKVAYSLSAKKLSKKWIKQNFRKGTPFPVSLKSDKETLEWIKTHPKSIGFISTLQNEVPIIYTFKD
ncbi:hypothetical protein JHD50_05680 [Sulfurimonas sp. MAG313]|nr:hypothetical protein [Sulfurimonas sp. MAG313]MDF1880798.1 hypothetical protein [Sulfurimonas sp. MAG313]